MHSVFIFNSGQLNNDRYWIVYFKRMGWTSPWLVVYIPLAHGLLGVCGGRWKTVVALDIRRQHTPVQCHFNVKWCNYCKVIEFSKLISGGYLPLCEIKRASTPFFPILRMSTFFIFDDWLNPPPNNGGIPVPFFREFFFSCFLLEGLCCSTPPFFF